MTQQILLIDDDALLRRSLAFNLSQAGYQVIAADSAETGLILAAQAPPDLVLLDIGLPGMDGLQALRHFQARFAAPVVFLTARRRPFDEVAGLELGAHDYVTKPFDTDVLIARIKSVLRRTESAPRQATPGLLTVGDLCVDSVNRTATRGGKELCLTPFEFNILYVLSTHAGQLVSAENLLAEVWGSEHAVEPQVIYVHMRGLRLKLEEDANRPRRLITVHGAGYKLVPQEA
jgi:DNA-binding response OmpR family regulator